MVDDLQERAASDPEGGVLSPSEIEKMMMKEGRGRRRLVMVLFVGMGLIVYSWALLTLRSFIVNTEWRRVFPGEVLLNGVFGCFVAIPMGFLFSFGYLVGKACLRHSRRWVAAMILPAMLGVVVLGFGVRHRLNPGVAFENILERELPEGARVVRYDYDETVLEEHVEIHFFAAHAEIIKLLEELRLVPDPAIPTQRFDSVPCKGDWASLSVDWPSGRVILKYLDV